MCTTLSRRRRRSGKAVSRGHPGARRPSSGRLPTEHDLRWRGRSPAPGARPRGHQLARIGWRSRWGRPGPGAETTGRGRRAGKSRHGLLRGGKVKVRFWDGAGWQEGVPQGWRGRESRAGRAQEAPGAPGPGDRRLRLSRGRRVAAHERERDRPSVRSPWHRHPGLGWGEPRGSVTPEAAARLRTRFPGGAQQLCHKAAWFRTAGHGWRAPPPRGRLRPRRDP